MILSTLNVFPPSLFAAASKKHSTFGACLLQRMDCSTILAGAKWVYCNKQLLHLCLKGSGNNLCHSNSHLHHSSSSSSSSS